MWELVKALSISPRLPRPVREVAILVTGAKFHSAYELYAHVLAAELRGLPDEKISTIVAGQRPSDLTEEEGIAYDVASNLISGGVLPTLTYKRAVGAFGAGGRGRAHLSRRAVLRGLGHAERLRRAAARGRHVLSLHSGSAD